MSLSRELRSVADPEKAKVLSRFFKTEPGQYGEGDQFLGITMPQIRKICKSHQNTMNLKELQDLLASQWHEERMAALVILTNQSKIADRNKDFSTISKIKKFYLANKAGINSWDLVDISAKQVLGSFYFEYGRADLVKLARSRLLWDRRLAVLATFYFINKKDYTTSLELAKILINDDEDLLHKAVGWMLREVGKKDIRVLYQFLDQFSSVMPRTMLRYSLEKVPSVKRKQYMKAKGSSKKNKLVSHELS